MNKIFTPFLIFLSFQFSFATDYYVSSSMGNDTNNGTSSVTPWQTFNKIQSFSFSPGDKILLKKGDVGIKHLNFTHQALFLNL